MKAAASPARLGAARVVLVLAAVAVAAGCAKRSTQVDVGYTLPEGVPTSNSRLLMWRAASNSMNVFLDVVPLGPSTNDPLVGTQTIVGDPIGSIHGMVFDRTPAEAYQMLRREPGGGFRAWEDFLHRPVRKWLATEWETYRFDDASPSGFQPPGYVARGVVDEHLTPTAPLSDEAVIPSAPLGNIDVRVTLEGVVDDDTVSVIRWDTVPDAVDYLIHIYEFRVATVRQQQLSGLPMPIYDDAARDHFVLWFRWGPGSVAQYKLGDTTRADLDIVFQRPLLPQPDPSVTAAIVRVSAFDPSGRLIAYSQSPTGQPPGAEDVFPRNYGIAPISDTEYGVFPLGALQVESLRFPRPRPSPLAE